MMAGVLRCMDVIVIRGLMDHESSCGLQMGGHLKDFRRMGFIGSATVPCWEGGRHLMDFRGLRKARSKGTSRRPARGEWGAASVTGWPISDR
jgi:hypothetical protein